MTLDADRLFREYHGTLVRYLTRRLGDRDWAEEVAQETFVRALRQTSIDNERSWLFAVATNLVRDEARSVRNKAGLARDQARLDSGGVKIRKASPFRAQGTVGKAISVRTSKVSRRAGDIGVFVNVRPAKAGQRGAKNPRDPFYWRFLEFGTRKMAKREFLKPAAAKLPAALEIFKTQLGRWIEKTNTTGKVEP